MENSTYIKFGLALLFIIIYCFAFLLVFLDQPKIKKAKNIDIEEEILSSYANQVNKKKFTAYQPTVHSRKNIRLKNKMADKNKMKFKKNVL